MAHKLMNILDQLTELMAKAPAFPDQIIEDPDDIGRYECPCCDGEGIVEREWVVCAQSSSWPGGVQFYGIGHEHQWAEQFYLAARTHLPALIAVARAAEEIESVRNQETGEEDIPDQAYRLGVALESLHESLAQLKGPTND